jgi:purine-binding chemotaxis protein CheW
MSEENENITMNGDDHIKDMYLTFGIEDEEYAVNIAHVTEIVGMQKISEVPDVPVFIKGVTNLRGKVIPVMDVRLRFGLPHREYDDRTTIIVLEMDNVPTGLVVDRVTDVAAIPEANIDPPPHWSNTTNTQRVIRGLGKQSDRVSIILDTQRLLYADRL